MWLELLFTDKLYLKSESVQTRKKDDNHLAFFKSIVSCSHCYFKLCHKVKTTSAYNKYKTIFFLFIPRSKTLRSVLDLCVATFDYKYKYRTRCTV